MVLLGLDRATGGSGSAKFWIALSGCSCLSCDLRLAPADGGACKLLSSSVVFLAAGVKETSPLVC